MVVCIIKDLCIKVLWSLQTEKSGQGFGLAGLFFKSESETLQITGPVVRRIWILM